MTGRPTESLPATQSRGTAEDAREFVHHGCLSCANDEDHSVPRVLENRVSQLPVRGNGFYPVDSGSRIGLGYLADLGSAWGSCPALSYALCRRVPPSVPPALADHDDALVVVPSVRDLAAADPIAVPVGAGRAATCAGGTAALGGFSWRRFATADVAAAILWSTMYAACRGAGCAMP